MGRLTALAPDAAVIQMADLRNLILTNRANNPRLRMAVRADKDVKYGIMADIMKILQETNTTRFNLVTELETDFP